MATLHLRSAVLVACTLTVAGCAAPAVPRLPSRSARGKLDVFGDAALVPTREGEAARHELALAGEIERAIAVLPAVDRVVVDVEAPPAGPPRAVVSVRVAGADIVREAVRTDATALASGILGPDADIVLVIAAPDVLAPAEPERPAWPLWLALMGFGASLGVAGERLLGRRRSHGRRRRASV